MRWKGLYSQIWHCGNVFICARKGVLSEVYFDPAEIKGQILRAIEECKESVDVAVLDITSKDILNAIMKAQERGVRVRIVVDRKRALRKGLLSNQDKNKEFMIIKVLVRKGDYA